MAANKLTAEKVNIILKQFLTELDYWQLEGKEAEKQLCYIAGANDIANAVIRAIEDLDRK